MRARLTPWCPGLFAAVAGSAAALGAPPFPPSIELSTLAGTDGFVLNGIDFDDRSGWSVSRAGDINGDGVDDLLIGAYRAGPNGRLGAGESYVVFGRDTLVHGAFGSALDLSTLHGANGFVINGAAAGEFAGWSVSDAGDINGDGFDDVIIGARYAAFNGLLKSGAAYVVFGGPGVGASGVLELSALDGVTGFVATGIDVGDRAGWSVSGAGDINGDGVDDVVIGADRADPNAQLNSGESYVVFGRRTSITGPFAPVLSLGALNGGNGFTINGIDANDYSGVSVSAAGDVNGDGLDDLIIGAMRADPNGQTGAGEAYVVFGKSYSLLRMAPPILNLSTLNGTTGFVINGINPDDRSAISVSGAGDVNGDGVDDVIVGAYRADPGGRLSAGIVYVVFGKKTPIVGPFAPAFNLSTLDGTNGFAINGIDVSDESGFSVSAGGDANGDGVDDILIGARGADPGGDSGAGETYLILGKDVAADGPFAGAINASALTGADGCVINGVDTGDFVGRSVSFAGDVNGDGIDDIIMGAPYADPNARVSGGESYVVFGRTPPLCPGDVNGDGDTNISDFNILAGNFGSAVAPNTGGDLTGDGLVNISDFNILAGDFGCGN